MSYTQVFGGNTIYTADPSYLALALTGDTSLSWALEADASSTPVASIIDVTPTGAFSITMPPADRASVGETILFNNLGPSTITVLDNVGGTILTAASGTQWQIYLIDTSTAAGTWRSYRFGAATATAQSSSLAGFGIKATGSTLSQESLVTSTGTNISVGSANRAQTLVWTGGSGTFSLGGASTLGDGFVFHVHNDGTGALTLDPSGAEQINGTSTVLLDPGDSATVVCTGSEWYTIGLGKDAVFAFDYTAIDLTGESSPYVLSGAELNRVSYKFTGTLTADMVIEVPATIQQYWVDNDTSGAFTLSVGTNGQVGPPTVAQGARSILYSDGLQVLLAETGGIAVPIAVSQGGTAATTAGGALINLGGSSDGIAIFTAANTNAIWTVLGAAPSGTVDGGAF